MKFYLRKHDKENEIEFLDDKIENEDIVEYCSGEVDSFRLYTKEMNKFPVLNYKEQRNITKKLYERLQDCASIIFSKTDFSSKYFRMMFNGSEGLESFKELMPDRKYTYIEMYLRNVIIKTIGKRNFKKLMNGDKELIKNLSETNHDRKSLNEIYKDLLYARKKIDNFRDKDLKARELGFKSLQYFDAYLNKLKFSFESYETIFKRFTEHNLRLVIKMANKYHTTTIIDKADLIQEGNIGLMRAIEKFDYRKGFAFSSYAVWWINQSIFRSVMEKSNLIKLPLYLNERMRKVQKIANKFYQEHCREPTPEEIAVLSGLSINKVAIMLEAPKLLFSLNDMVDEGLEFMDIITDPYAKSAEEETSEIMLSEDIDKSLEEILTPKEEKILRMRNGFGEIESTLEDVGREFEFSRERVRQIENKALKKLRRSKEIEELRSAI